MTVMHDPGPGAGAPKLPRGLRHMDQKPVGGLFCKKMNSDELPMYPTPQQATYTMPPLAASALRRNNSSNNINIKPVLFQGPSSSGPPPSNGYNNHSTHSNRMSPHAQDYNSQSSRPYQPQLQYYQQSQQQPAVVSSPHYLDQNSYQNNGYHPLPPQQSQQPSRPAQHRSALSVSQQYYLGAPPPPQQNPPAPSATSTSSSHYSTAPQPVPFHQGNQYKQPQPLSLPGSRHTSYSSQQYSQSPLQALSPTSGRSHAQSKKPPLGLTNRSRENLEEPPKPSSKQRLDAELRATFDRVDTTRSGRISARELTLALINFDNTGFQQTTVRLMIKLFSNPTSGTTSGLNFEQFVSLWKYLTAYKKLFVAADVNKSGDISFGEFQRIIEQIGYKLNVDLVLHLFQKFANKESYDDGSVAVGKLKFDAFIELLVYLRKLTDIFKQYDKQLTGVATIDYLDFLFEISNLT